MGEIKTSQMVNLRMSPELHQAVKERAASEERTMSQLVRHAIKRYLSTEADS